MINISFSDCLTGTLKVADYYAKQDGSSIQNLSENIYRLGLDLDLGDISEPIFSKKRKQAFLNMYGNKRFSAREKWFDENMKSIAKIEKMAKSGQEIRIWYSERSNELCAFCWMLSILDSWGVDNERILFVKLPQSIIFDNGEFETFGGSGMFEPETLTQLVFRQRYLTTSYKEYHIEQWERAREENAEMRIALNEQILSVNEDFYDSVILSEIEKLDDTFREVIAIGNSLAKLWTSDAFVAWRIDEMIKKGMFTIAQEAKKGELNYCRWLKKA